MNDLKEGDNTENQTQEQDQTERLTVNGGPMGKTVTIENLPIGKIKLQKNSRLNISDEELAGLMQSIKEVGLLQPIGVVKKASGFEICYGNRRWLACSKLGMKRVPAVVHTNKNEVEGDLQNLTENIQRRNISLAEAGRYMEILNGSGLSMAEIAVRLGVSKSYVESCLNAYRNVPQEFRNDLEVRAVNDRKRKPGKISITVANAIISAAKSYNLPSEQKAILFKAAKSDDKFAKENIPQYASALKQGKKDPIKSVNKLQPIRVQFFMEERHKEDLMKKYVYDGPFKSLNGLMVAILKGEKLVKVNIV